MRIGVHDAAQCWRARRAGNKGRFIQLSWLSFWRGYKLVAQFQAPSQMPFVLWHWGVSQDQVMRRREMR